LERFRNILALYGDAIGSEAALARAEELAKCHRARLTVAEIVSRAAPFGLRDRLLADRHCRLERLVAPARQNGIAAETLILEGPAHSEIPEVVARQGHDLVILAEDDRSFLRDLVRFGTVSRLLRSCACPVWVVSQKAETSFRCVMAAVKVAFRDDASFSRDARVLKLAASLAQAKRCRLDVVHAWDLAGRDRETSRSECPSELLAALNDAERTAHERMMGDLLSSTYLDGASCNVHLRKGPLDSVLANLASELEADVIVMGRMRRKGLARQLAAESAELVLRRVDCAVLAIGPAPMPPSSAIINAQEAGGHVVEMRQRCGRTSGTFSERIR